MSVNILALDFDGVIGDTVDESIVVGYNAYAKMSGTVSRICGMQDLTHPLAEESRRLRKYVRGGEDFVYLWNSLLDGVIIKEQKDFDEYRASSPYDPETSDETFYLERERFWTEEPDVWIGLNPLYPGMADFLRGYSGNLIIITNKRLVYIHRILQANNIPIAEKDTFQPGLSNTKRNVISEILKEKNCQPQDFHFVEDQVDNAISVQPLGIHCYLAEWGYNDEAQAKRASENGVEVITLDNFFGRFSSIQAGK